MATAFLPDRVLTISTPRNLPCSEYASVKSRVARYQVAGHADQSKSSETRSLKTDKVVVSNKPHVRRNNLIALADMLTRAWIAWTLSVAILATPYHTLLSVSSPCLIT